MLESPCTLTAYQTTAATAPESGDYKVAIISSVTLVHRGAVL